MRQVPTYKWWLPPPVWKPKGKRYLSSWHMDEKDARERGAIEPDLTTLRMRDVPETPEEAQLLQHQSDTSMWGIKRPENDKGETDED